MISGRTQKLDSLSDIIDSELDSAINQAANQLGGRIMVINDHCMIVKDTYNIDEGKLMVSGQILQSYDGKPYTVVDDEAGYIQVVYPIINADGGISGIVYAASSMNDVNRWMDNSENKSWLILIGSLSLLVVLSLFFSHRLTGPLKQLIHSIEDIDSGDITQFKTVSNYEETQKISDAYNHLLEKLRENEDSRQEFVSNVSHELKTPMTSVKVLADSLVAQEGSVPNELYQEFMRDITGEIDRENKIINDLLSLVKLDRKNENLNIEKVNINDLLENVLKRLRPIAAKSNIELVLESFRPVSAEVDEVKLELAFTNLVENAIKYNHENGWVHVSLNADHKYFYVKISDNGIGIPTEDQDRIFERFYRVDKSHSREIGGTGLGLAITRSAVLLHRGAIRLSSEPGEGTTFNIRIPLNYIS